MDVWLRAGLIVLCSVLGSGGLWAYLQTRDVRRNATTKLLMGFAYERLVTLGRKHTDRGYISDEEFRDYLKYFYEPYTALGGNGHAARVMQDVSALTIRNRNEGFHNNVRIVSSTEPQAAAEQPQL